MCRLLIKCYLWYIWCAMHFWALEKASGWYQYLRLIPGCNVIIFPEVLPFYSLLIKHSLYNCIITIIGSQVFLDQLCVVVSCTTE